MPLHIPVLLLNRHRFPRIFKECQIRGCSVGNRPPLPSPHRLMTFQRAIVRNERLSVPSGSSRLGSSFQRCIFGSTIVCRCIKRPVRQPTIYFRWRIEPGGGGALSRARFNRESRLPLPFPSLPFPPLPSFGKCVTRRSAITLPPSSLLLPLPPALASRFHGRKQKLHAPGTPHNEFLFIARSLARSLAATRF